MYAPEIFSDLLKQLSRVGNQLRIILFSSFKCVFVEYALAKTVNGKNRRSIEINNGIIEKLNRLIAIVIFALCMVGFGVGLAAGFAICNADNDAYTCGSEADLLGDFTVAVIFMTAALGDGVGAIVGSFIKTERWQEAALPASPPVALNVGKDGSVGLVFSLRL